MNKQIKEKINHCFRCIAHPDPDGIATYYRAITMNIDIA